MKAVTSKVKDMAKEKNTWVENKSVWDYEKVMKKWDSISPEFKVMWCRTKRKNEISYATVFGMSKANAFNNPSNKKSRTKKARANKKATEEDRQPEDNLV